MLKWEGLLNLKRRKPAAYQGLRTEGERDYDRILFSTPVRRLADKTQVFPLERHDSVHTRLTHSLEVSNLCRSVGTALALDSDLFSDIENAHRDVPSILGAVGLAHDLGNPPFGHQGEEAIKNWFAENQQSVFDVDCGVPDKSQSDFLRFEGNAQTLRVLSRLQIISDDFGLNLSYATLAAMLKYAVPGHEADKKSSVAAAKKPGFFQSEAAIVDEIRQETGLTPGVRHPFAFIVEACDDLAYAVMDVEDAVKKGMVSYLDVASHIRAKIGSDATGLGILDKCDAKHDEFRQLDLSAAECNDITMQKFRVYAIEALIRGIVQAFKANCDGMLDGSFVKPLMGMSSGGAFHNALDKFNRTHVYKHRSILEVELIGHRVISGLMTRFWDAIVCNRRDEKKPFENYVYSRISENYRRVCAKESSLPLRYKEVQLATDMVAGMTDTFAVALYNELEERHGGGTSFRF